MNRQDAPLVLVLEQVRPVRGGLEPGGVVKRGIVVAGGINDGSTAVQSEHAETVVQSASSLSPVDENTVVNSWWRRRESSSIRAFVSVTYRFYKTEKT